jgi:hypothetical protein
MSQVATSRATFDVSLITHKIENVLQQGLNEILVKYIEKYEMYETSFQQLLAIPAISHELQCRIDMTPKNTNCSSTNSFNTMLLQSKIHTIELERTIEELRTKILCLENQLTTLSFNAESVNHAVVDGNEVELAGVDVSGEDLNCLLAHCERITQTDDIAPEPTSPLTETVDDAEEADEEADDGEEVEEADEEEAVDDAEEADDEEEVEVEVEADEVEEADNAVEEVVEEEEEEAEEEEAKEEEEEEAEEDNSVETIQHVIEEEDDDEDIFEIEIDDVTYCTNNEETGFIWEMTSDGEQGDKVGYFKDGEPIFYAEEN